MNFGEIAGSIAGSIFGGKEEDQNSNYLGMAEKGMETLGVTKEMAIGKAAGVVSSATGLDAE